MNTWVALIISVCIGIVAAALIVFGVILVAGAHEHQAGEDAERARVVEFYRTWQRPKGQYSIVHRQGSCCWGNGEYQDCFPVQETRKENGHLWVLPNTDGASSLAQASYSGRWYDVDEYRVAESLQPDPRESPDGRSHVCISGSHVICYVEGWGN